MKNVRRIYTKSLANLIFLNSYYKLAGQNEYRKYILEPSKCKRNSFIAFIAAVMMTVLYPIVLFIQTIKTQKQRKKNHKLRKEFKKILFIDANPSNGLKLLRKAKIDEKDITWITKCHLDKIDEEQQVSIFELLSLKDIVLSYFDSLFAYYNSLIRYGLVVSFLGINTLEWFLYYRALISIPPNNILLSCHQIDPVALLIDNISHQKKILLQHGTVIFKHNTHNLPSEILTKDKDYDIWVYNMPIKLQNLDVMYAFSEEEYIGYKLSMCKCNPESVIVGYGIKTTKLNMTGFTVLIIGYFKGYGDREEKVIGMLNEAQVNVLIKNHPMQDVSAYNKLKAVYNFEILNMPVFPVVDLVISYESTLALEYASIGINVIYYDDIDWENFSNYIQDLKMQTQ